MGVHPSLSPTRLSHLTFLLFCRIVPNLSKYFQLYFLTIMEVDVLYFQCCEVTKPSLVTLLHRSRWHCWLIEIWFRGRFECSTLNIFEGNDKFQVRSVIADPPPLSPDHGGTIALTKLWQNRQNSGSWGDLAEGGRVLKQLHITKHLVIT